MRIIVCGGRNYDDRARVFEVLDALHALRPISHVVTGGARGADMLATAWAGSKMTADNIANGTRIPGFSYCRANWRELGRSAGPIRNAHMLTAFEPELVVAFPGGPGTKDMIRQAKKAGVKVIEVSP